MVGLIPMEIIFNILLMSGLMFANVLGLYALYKLEKWQVKPWIVACLIAVHILAMADILTSDARYMASGMSFIPLLFLVNMLILTAVIDLASYYIFNYVLYFYAGLGALYKLSTGESAIDMLISVIAGLALYFVVYYLAKRFYGKEAFGMGDVYFLGAIGVFFSVGQTLVIGLLAFYIAIFFILFNYVKNRSLGLKSEIPFGPSIAVAAYLMALHVDTLLALYDGFQNLIDMII